MGSSEARRLRPPGTQPDQELIPAGQGVAGAALACDGEGKAAALACDGEGKAAALACDGEGKAAALARDEQGWGRRSRPRRKGRGNAARHVAGTGRLWGDK